MNSLDLVDPDRTFRRAASAVIMEDDVPQRERIFSSGFFLRAARDQVQHLRLAIDRPTSEIRTRGVRVAAQALIMALIGIPGVIEADPRHQLHHQFGEALGTLCTDCLAILDRDARPEDVDALAELRETLQKLHDRFVPQVELPID